MAEQIIGHGFLNEKALSSMNVKKERIHIGTMLISNSVIMYNYIYILVLNSYTLK